MNILKRTNRFYYTRPDGYPQIRVYHKKGSGKKMEKNSFGKTKMEIEYLF